MDIETLLRDKRNSLKTTVKVDRRRYRQSVDHLERYKFWPAQQGVTKSVWEHQEAATSLLAAYLSSNRSIEPEAVHNEAALVKMATGSGKSAVITLVSRCLPQIRRVLIVTPRAALTDQILQYVRHKFWATMGLSVGGAKSIYVDEDGSDAGAVVESAYAVRLLPSSIISINDAGDSEDRMVVVGTLQGLDQIRRQSIQKLSADDAKNRAIEASRDFLDLLRSFDLVIVDEGHYEPAISWSRAIRDADLPTILFSATPYRNDYKSFRVKGRFVFNQPIQEALEGCIIRTPSIEALEGDEHRETGISPPAVSPESTRFTPEESEDSRDQRELTTTDKADARAFAIGLAEKMKSLKAPVGLKNWKVIVRAERLPKLVLLQELLQDFTGEKALVIHHAVKRNDAKIRRYDNVHSAQQSDDSDQVRVWLHETKLLEGVDDPSFLAAAIYDNFGNTRQLVQQIGRVLRSSDDTRTTRQQAFVFASPRHAEDIDKSWQRYLKFEEYCAENTEYVVVSEAALPDRLMEVLPDLQYVEGEFRERFMLDGTLRAEDVQLPASAAVFDFKGTEFNREFIRAEISEAVLANDRFQPIEIRGLPENAVAVAYYGWKTSPWLKNHFFPEWTFGLCIVAQVGDLVFAHDTSGIVFDSRKLQITRLDQSDLVRAIPESSPDRPVRVMRMSAASLDLSERAIRAQATRTASFEHTFTDLLDPGMFPTSAFGRVGRDGRYLGFTQARVRDTKPLPLPLSEYLKWAEGVENDIVARELSENPVFGRYAKTIPPPEKDEAMAENILIDLGDSFEDFKGQKDDQPLRDLMQDVDTPDLCADVKEGEFDVEIAGRTFACEIEYKEQTHRYRISSPELDSFFLAQSTSGRRSAFTFCEVLNRSQSFRVLPKKNKVVYANGKFYSPHGLEMREDGTFPQLDNVVAVPILAELKTEKGEKIYPKNKAAWKRQSQFGVIKAICEISEEDPIPETYGELGKELKRFDLIVCDDDGQEIGDFLAIDTERRLVCVIHAKASKVERLAAVSALQEVGRQALASLAFCSGVAVTPKVAKDRWGTDVRANDSTLVGLNRIFKNSKDLELEDARSTILNALRNRSWNKEVWIVAARLLNLTTFRRRLESNPSNLTMQTSMYLASLTTSCARANARLRVFCHQGEEVDGVPESLDIQ